MRTMMKMMTLLMLMQSVACTWNHYLPFLGLSTTRLNFNPEKKTLIKEMRSEISSGENPTNPKYTLGDNLSQKVRWCLVRYQCLASVGSWYSPETLLELGYKHTAYGEVLSSHWPGGTILAHTLAHTFGFLVAPCYGHWARAVPTLSAHLFSRKWRIKLIIVFPLPI